MFYKVSIFSAIYNFLPVKNNHDNPNLELRNLAIHCRRILSLITMCTF